MTIANFVSDGTDRFVSTNCADPKGQATIVLHRRSSTYHAFDPSGYTVRKADQTAGFETFADAVRHLEAAVPWTIKIGENYV